MDELIEWLKAAFVLANLLAFGWLSCWVLGVGANDEG